MESTNICTYSACLSSVISLKSDKDQRNRALFERRKELKIIISSRCSKRKFKKTFYFSVQSRRLQTQWEHFSNKRFRSISIANNKVYRFENKDNERNTNTISLRLRSPFVVSYLIG